MRIICCHNGQALKPETRNALIEHGEGYAVEFVDVSGSLSSYWHAIRDHWTGDEDLVTVEQDNVITAEVLPSFEACSQDWCCYAYPGGFYYGVPDGADPNHVSRIEYGLGCTKFSAGFQRRFPASTIAGDNISWYFIDFRMKILFHELHKLSPHIHGDIAHLHEMPAT